MKNDEIHISKTELAEARDFQVEQILTGLKIMPEMITYIEETAALGDKISIEVLKRLEEAEKAEK